MATAEEIVRELDMLNRRNAVVNADSGIEQSPDDAIRARQIEEHSGLPAATYMSDPKVYDLENRRAMTNLLISGNSHLQRYINDNPPVHSVASNDDWGSLDKYSEQLDRLKGPSVMKMMLEGWKRGADPDTPLGLWAINSPQDIAWVAAHPTVGPFFQALTQGAGAVLELGPRLISGATQAAHEGIKGVAMTSFGKEDYEAEQIADHIMAGVEFKMTDMASQGAAGFHHVKEGIEHLRKQVNVTALAPQIEAQRSVAAAYSKSGESIPFGISPVTDEAHRIQTVSEVSALDDALEAAIETRTRDRAPELVARFTELKTGQRDIQVPAEAIRKLYGAEQPKPDDGILGWLKNLPQQLAAAEPVGGKVSIPIKDWLANVEPEVAKALHDDVAVGEYSWNEVAQSPNYEPQGVTPQGAEARQHEDVTLGLARREGGLNNFTSPTSPEQVIEPNPQDLSRQQAELQLRIEQLKEQSTNLNAQTREYPGSRTKERSAIGAELAQKRAQLGQILDQKERIYAGLQPDDPALKGAKAEIDSLRDTLGKPEISDQGIRNRIEREGTGLFSGRMRQGLTNQQMANWERSMQKRIDFDKARKESLAAKQIAREESAKWKEARERLHPEAVDEVNSRPDIIADEYLRLGRVGDKREKGTPRLDRKFLTKQQIAELHPDHVARKGEKGISPDDLAERPEIGYATGEALVQNLALLHQARGKQMPYRYKEQLVKERLRQKLEKEMGDFDENVMEEARDHAVAQTQIDMLHEEFVAHRMRLEASGVDMRGIPNTKEQFARWVNEKFDQTNVKLLDPIKFLQAAGRYGAAMEAELMKPNGNPVDAFKHRQMQYANILLSKEAMAFQRELKAANKIWDRYRPRGPIKGRPQEFVNFIQQMMATIGKKVDVTKVDMDREIQAGTYKSLQDFIKAKQADHVDLAASELLTNPTLAKKFEAMNGEEAREVMATFKLWDTNARDEGRVISAGEKMDLEAARDRLKERLDRFDDAKIAQNEQRRPGMLRTLQGLNAQLIQMSYLLRRMDGWDESGPWTQLVWRPMLEASLDKRTIQREVAQEILKIKDKTNLKEKIPNRLFRWQHDYNGGRLMDFNRESLRSVMFYLGSDSSAEKLAMGYGLQIQEIVDWVNTVAKKEDWEWCTKMGKVYEGLYDRAAPRYRERNGLAPPKIETRPIDTTALGRIDGWYNPVVYDRIQLGNNADLVRQGGNPLEQYGFHHVITASNHFKQRTGYFAPVELNFNQLGSRIEAYIHDIAFHDAVKNTDKYFRDNGVINKVGNKLGPAYRDLLNSWLRVIANNENFRAEENNALMRGIEAIRRNTVQNYIAFNASTPMKHGLTALGNSIAQLGVGKHNFARATFKLFTKNDATSDFYFRFVKQEGEEVQSRMKNIADTISGATGETFDPSKYRTAREFWAKLGTYPTALGDLLSTYSVWLGTYERILEEGGSIGDAKFAANDAVIQAHGSVAEVNRPMLMQNRNPFVRSITSLYGFFSHMYNKRMEMTWKAGELLRGREVDGFGDAMSKIAGLGGNVVSYYLWPALVSYAVSPFHVTNTDHEGFLIHFGKSLIDDVGAGIPLLRELVFSWLNNSEPGMGVLDTSFQQPFKFGHELISHHDLKHASPEQLARIIQDGIGALGIFTAWASVHEGDMAAFLYRWEHGLERPQGPWGWLVGLRYGTIKGHAPTAYDRFFTNRIQR